MPDMRKDADKLGDRIGKEAKKAMKVVERAGKDIAVGAGVVAEESKKFAEKAAKEVSKDTRQVKEDVTKRVDKMKKDRRAA